MRGARVFPVGELVGEVESELTAEEVAHRLAKPRRTGSGWTACCPAHEDSDPSLSISDGEKGVVVKCHAGCPQENVLSALEFMGVEIRRPKVNGNGHAHHEEFNLAILAAAKKLPVEFLTECFVHDEPGCVAFEYLDAFGAPFRTKYRRALTGNRGFSTSGGKMVPYGLWRMEQMMANDARLIICEGETDTLTLWHHGFSALGISGADGWKEEFCGSIPEGAKVFVAIDADEGGKKFEESFRASKLAPRVHFIRMREDAKDPSVLHCCGPDHFIEAWEDRMAGAEPALKYDGLPMIDLCDMHAHLTDSYIIKNFLPANSESWVLGMPGSGKTFFVTDMALHIANNIQWMGRRVRGGLVVYIGAENARSVERRFTGARDNKPEFRKDAPLVLTPGPVDLKVNESLELIMRTVRAAEAKHKQKCVLVIVDTLSRAGGGKEDTEDFGACLRGCGRLKSELETSVMLIHHVGKDPSRGGRGWSGMNGGVDLEVMIAEEGDTKVATVSKARDGQDGDRFGFKLEQVVLGQDTDGDQVVTCIVRSIDAPVAECKRPSGKYQTAILKEAEERTAMQPGLTWTQTELMQMCKDIDIGVSTARKAILNLRELGYFQPTIGGSKLAYHPLGKREK